MLLLLRLLRSLSLEVEVRLEWVWYCEIWLEQERFGRWHQQKITLRAGLAGDALATYQKILSLAAPEPRVNNHSGCFYF
jgi:hypothetical protein